MSKLKEQIKSYEEQLRNMTVMDDYDGGAANQLRMVIDDLRKLDTKQDAENASQQAKSLAQFSKSWYEKK